MSAGPKFEVLDPVVITDQILVMDRLIGSELTTEVVRHDDSVFQGSLPLMLNEDVSILDVPSVVGPRSERPHSPFSDPAILGIMAVT